MFNEPVVQKPCKVPFHQVALLGLIYCGEGGRVGKMVACPEGLKLFNNEIYLVPISAQKSLIKVAIYKIYCMKWMAGPQI